MLANSPLVSMLFKKTEMKYFMFGFVPIDVCCRKITLFYYCDFMIFGVSGQSQYIMQGVAVLVFNTVVKSMLL